MAQQSCQTAEGKLINGKIAKVNAGLIHGAALFWCYRGIRIYPEHEREEYQSEALLYTLLFRTKEETDPYPRFLIRFGICLLCYVLTSVTAVLNIRSREL